MPIAKQPSDFRAPGLIDPVEQTGAARTGRAVAPVARAPERAAEDSARWNLDGVCRAILEPQGEELLRFLRSIYAVGGVLPASRYSAAASHEAGADDLAGALRQWLRRCSALGLI